ncbi:tetratricopeptide repeat protein [Schlesneria sp. T3-172]|uniref:tetratricopeptide repeat protein n=1 Tax=Schlesneria sphaerica TaxID=3373610 RepID=UPI0037C8B20C
MAVRTLHITIKPAGAERYTLRYWRDDPNKFTEREVTSADLKGLLDRAEADYYAFSDPDLVTVGKRLYDWLDGSDRWLARELDQLRGSTVALLIDANPVLAPLPWETLHDGVSFLVRAANPTIIPIRWRTKGPSAPEPHNRALHVLFMASSPLGVNELNFEAEEATILRSTDRHRITLSVEETGSLDELEVLAAGFGENAIDVVHLTGHADHHGDGPKFLTEDDTGKPKWVSAEQIARAIPHIPRLAFLSGCRTAQSPNGGAMRSLAEELLDRKFPAVLGWGRPVYDIDATMAAGSLYERLGQGVSVVEALAHVHRDLADRNAKHWHLLRLFASGETLGPVVTAPNTPKRKPALLPSHGRRFLTKSLNVGNAVVSRTEFVGRRRPLQRVIRHLRMPIERRVGVVVFGTGGVGKSSVALRVCDRLTTFDPIVLVGVLDEPALLRVMESVKELTDEQRNELQGSHSPLTLRFRRFLERRRDDGGPPPLLILDDFEQNYQTEGGTPKISSEAVAVLDGIVAAFDQLEYGRCLITSRFQLNTSHKNFFYQESMLAMSAGEVERKRRFLQNLSKSPNGIRKRVEAVADGNPRLLERLDQLLATSDIDFDALLKSMEKVAAEFREQVCLSELLNGLPESARRLLGAALVYRLPVPLGAIAMVAGGRPEAEVQKDLDAAVAVGLCERESNGDAYRTPQLLESEIATDLRPDPVKTAELAAVALKTLWWDSKPTSEEEALELLRLACLAGRADVAVPVADRIGFIFHQSNRYQEARSVYEEAIASVGRDFRLLSGLSNVLQLHGEGDVAFATIEEAIERCRATPDTDVASVLFQYSNQLIGRGQLDQAMTVIQAQLLPMLDVLGDEQRKAVTMGQIADLLNAQGNMDEALRIRREEQLPVYEKFGDVRNKAVAMGRIADILQAQGQWEEAVRIRRQEQLPVFDQLGDVRSKAVTMSKIADVLQAQGQWEEALRIRREEQLPVFDRLGDVGNKAWTMGKIAEILQAQGQLDDALQIFRTELVPVFVQLGDVRSKALAMGRIADILYKQGKLDDVLKIRLEEELPVFERLGDLREKAVTMGKIADVLRAKGQLDEALQILRQELLPVFEQLTAVQEKAVTMGKIADILHARGELDEALRVYRHDVLPVYERLWDMWSLIGGRATLALILVARGRPDDQTEIVELLTWAAREATNRGYPEAHKYQQLLRQQMGDR